ncbi:sensor histidine kinase [Longispora albida]|uniref:sensor histidine kinase n=1 Tax=Longispora albida TaxID=203523 RepID=UPI00037A7993|nr:sensor histidine kinase [Longispora albida]
MKPTGESHVNAKRPGRLAALFRDLWPAEPDLVVTPGWPVFLARTLRVLLVLALAVLWFFHESALEQDFQLGALAALLAAVQCASVLLALRRPVQGWWLSTAVMTVAALQAGQRPGLSSDYPGTATQVAHMLLPTLQSTTPFPWTHPGIVLQCMVLFLLALRVRRAVLTTAIMVTIASGLAVAGTTGVGSREDVTASIPALLVAVIIGSAFRSRRLARDQLVAQEVLTEIERAQRTVLEERHRIARELHDVVAHHMSVISIQAQVAPHLVPDPPQELLDNAAGIRQNAVEALTELRRILGVLRSEFPDIDRHTPQPSLAQLGDLVANVRQAGLAVTITIAGEQRPLGPGAELSAYRIVQEALSNAMRHAPGSQITILVTYQAGGITLRVTNTRPPAPAQQPPGGNSGAGHGLLGMRERAAMLGGELAAGPVPGGGYEVTAVLPSHSRAGDQEADVVHTRSAQDVHSTGVGS